MTPPEGRPVGSGHGAIRNKRHCGHTPTFGIYRFFWERPPVDLQLSANAKRASGTRAAGTGLFLACRSVYLVVPYSGVQQKPALTLQLFALYVRTRTRTFTWGRTREPVRIGKVLRRGRPAN